MIAIARAILRIGLKGIPIFSIHIDSDRTMGRGAAAHSKYMANEYKAIKLKQRTSVLMQES